MKDDYFSETGFEYRLTEAGEAVVTGCKSKRENVVIPEALGGCPVTIIDKAAFRLNTSASDIRLPDTLITIEEQAFYGCGKLKRMYIPQSVVDIAGNPFAGCHALTEIETEPGNPRYRTADGVLYDADPMDPHIVCYPAGNPDRSFDMPAGLYYVGEYAFFGNCHLRKVVLCDDVGTIKAEAFAECSALKEIVIPDSVRRIETLAFFRCRSLEEIQLPDSVEELGTWAFAECDALTRVRLSKGLTDYSISAFRDCNKLERLIIPHGVKNLLIDDHVSLPPGEEKVIQVPSSVEWVSNENGWEGGGYTFYVPRNRRYLWSYWTFAKQDVRYRVKRNELYWGRAILRKQAKWWLWKLKWCFFQLLYRWSSSPWGRFKVVTIKDEEFEIPDEKIYNQLTSS